MLDDDEDLESDLGTPPTPEEIEYRCGLERERWDAERWRQERKRVEVRRGLILGSGLPDWMRRRCS